MELSALVQNSVKQNYLPLYTIILPVSSILKKNCSPYELPCPSLEPLRETLYIGGESHPSAKKCSFLAPENPPRQTTIFMQSPNISIIYSCSHCCCIIFLTPGFMYRYIMLILISRWLLNLIFSMRKASNGQISNHLIPPSLHFSMQFGKHCFNYCLFSFSFSPFFIFFLCGFSFTNIHESQDCRGKGRAFH